MSDFDYIANILANNSDKSFVKRILNKSQYPTLKNPDGSVSTHSMAWGEANGKYYVYPTVLTVKGGELKRFSDEDAWRHTQQTGNYIEFATPEEAEWFSKNYKKVWRQ